MMYKAVVHSVILYGSEIFVVMGDMLKVLEGFHHWAERGVTGMTATRGVGEEWQYPPVVTEIDASELHPIR